MVLYNSAFANVERSRKGTLLEYYDIEVSL